MVKIFKGLIIFLSLIIANPLLDMLPPDNYDSWKVLDKNEIKIEYTDDFDIPWCRATTVFPFSLEEIYFTLKDLPNYKNIFGRVTQSDLLDLNIVYIRLDMPYFLYDRDYTVKYIEEERDGSVFFKFHSVVHPSASKYYGAVNLPRASGQWILTSLSENTCKVTYIWNGELLGSFPSMSLHTAWQEQGSEVLGWLSNYIKEKGD